jgi:cellulose synthase/poly-beta-1,6-N-acetylglucosamine synthase-like glycosyltransferase
MITVLSVLCAATLAALTLLGLYEWVLAVVSLLPWKAPTPRSEARSRLLVLIPAYNEETGVAATVRSLQNADYPKAAVRTVVIADRCHDGTAERARACGAECLERRGGEPGKGAAIAWALDTLARGGADFDGLVLIDADTIADGGLLAAFDEHLRAGHEVQQGYHYLSNPWDSPFTRIISVTGILRNGLYYVGKERLGLPAMLSGNGMCFSRRIIQNHGWTAFSVGEDWEFAAQLLLDGEWIHFNEHARVGAAESQTFKQASSQRLRWASGRYGVASASARRLMVKGMRERRFDLWDAALTIVGPTYSVQATLALLCLAAGLVLAGTGNGQWLAAWAASVTALLAGYFLLGLALTEAPVRAVVGVLLIPVFLPWRMAIEILGLLGYGRKRWVRTVRLQPGE